MRTNNRAEMYYTYAYLREDGTPYYVGKGKGDRAYRKVGKPCATPKDKNKIIYLKTNLTEEQSFNHEKYMIFIFGRKDTGTGVLYNKTNGGDGVSGYILTEKDRKNKSWAKGKKFSELHKKRIGESNKGISRNTKERRKQLAEEIKNKPGKSPGFEIVINLENGIYKARSPF